ncbi:putative metallo-hydrolase YycJ [Methylacidimicrobium sp. AP8]|uniref:MBL fold metallo-hydrolase n=1 Tax=Methylacidimicrobium sp. AP8 TaxID=2730359 RepID=UPI0018C0E373|nr:MBL fold metallo-hydrolase [Methylacidimicrobium sp. AP8]CAB4243683.1 putative metallo-hydrolase YycJ [Methylacidimicrobium sp. AP8]
MLRLTILASGSSGNAALLEAGSRRWLVDAGLSSRRLEERLRAAGVEPSSLSGVFLTHEHADHARGLRVFLQRHSLPLYCNELTWLALGWQAKIDWRRMETAVRLDLGGMEIESFPVPHDAADPVGFLFHHPAGTIGVLTDLGYATRLVWEKMSRCRALLLEANHDPGLLQADSRRPWSVKQRILSRHGHLSNQSAAEIATELARHGLQEIILGHLSADCNRPELVEETVRSRLEEARLPSLSVHVWTEGAPVPPLCWG